MTVVSTKMEGVCDLCFGKTDFIYSFGASGMTPLLRAADNGHLKCMELLIKAGAAVNTPQNVEYGETSLMKAAKEGHVKCVELLLKSGADVNLWTTDKKRRKALLKRGRSIGGHTALYVAVINKKPECVELLTKAGADVNIQCYDSHYNMITPLLASFKAGNDQCAEILVEAGADVNIVDVLDGETALICAAQQSSARLIQLILKAGADINAINKWNATALYKAVVSGNGATARFLIQAGADVNFASDLGVAFTALKGMDDEEHLKTLCAFLEAGANVNAKHPRGETALIEAISSGKVKSAHFLLKKRADINSKDCFGNTALRIAIKSRHTGCIDLLVKEGADVNKFPDEDETPLTVASKKFRCIFSLKLLLEAGADVNIENSMGISGLNACEGDEQEVVDKVRLLLRAGAHVNKKANMGQRALYIGASWKTLIRILLAAGEILPFGSSEVESSCLKDVCRRRIRQILIDKDPHENLFVRIPQLGLPYLLPEYLLYGVSLEDQHGTPEEFADNR